AGEPPDPGVQLPTVVPSYPHLDHLDPPVGGGERLRELGEGVDLPVRGPGGGAQRGEVDAVRGAEDAVEAVGEGRVALLEHGEDGAAVVVDDHDGEVGARLVGAEHEPARVVEEGDV